MILYLDASALVKQYVHEPGSEDVNQMMVRSADIGTALITRAEVAAALAHAVRMHTLTPDAGAGALGKFHGQWIDFLRVQITELVVARAGAVAWEHGLRGYDAVHLAAALVWKESMGTQVTLATFDRELWLAARQASLIAWPDDLPALLEQWQAARL